MEVFVVLEHARVPILLKLDQELQIEQLCGNAELGRRTTLSETHVVQNVQIAADYGLKAQQAEPDFFDHRQEPLQIG